MLGLALSEKQAPQVVSWLLASTAEKSEQRVIPTQGQLGTFDCPADELRLGHVRSERLHQAHMGRVLNEGPQGRFVLPCGERPESLGERAGKEPNSRASPALMPTASPLALYRGRTTAFANSSSAGGRRAARGTRPWGRESRMFATNLRA